MNREAKGYDFKARQTSHCTPNLPKPSLAAEGIRHHVMKYKIDLDEHHFQGKHVRSMDVAATYRPQMVDHLHSSAYPSFLTVHSKNSNNSSKTPAATDSAASLHKAL
jgi:hypothetical protein